MRSARRRGARSVKLQRRSRARLSRVVLAEALEPRCLLAGLDRCWPELEGEADVVFQADFESGRDGFTFDNSGGRSAGMWHYSSGRRRDGLPNHTPDHSFYYGLFETATGGGRYDLSLSHQGVLYSPEIAVPACGAVASFNYLLDTRPELTLDFVEFRVGRPGEFTTLLSRAAGTLPETGNAWRTAVADLSAFAGQTVQLAFSFDTGEDVFVDPEGWYVDDVLVLAEPCPPGSLTGVKFNDVNQDGERQESEPVMSGVVMTLIADGADNSGPERTAVTDPQGRFLFDQLPPGDYVLGEQPPDHVLGPPLAIPVEVLAGQTAIQDASNLLAGGLAGVKYNDINGNAQLDSDDLPMAGVEFQLLDADGGQVSSAVSDASGFYAWENLPPGEYMLVEVPPQHAASQQPFQYSFTLRSGERLRSADVVSGPALVGQFETIDAAFNVANLLQGGLYGVKYHDRNRNGVRDPEEPGLEGIVLELSREVGGQGETLTTTTDDQGRYEFVGLPPDAYVLRESPPDYVLDPGDAGLELTVLSGQILAADVALAPAPLPGQFLTELPELFVANVLSGSLHGYVFEDLNGNGVDDQEPRIPGAALTLEGDVDGDGSPDVLSLVADANGEYHVRLLAPGPFTVTQTPQNGWVATTPSIVNVELQSGQEAEAIPGLATLLPGQQAVLVPGLAFGNQRPEPPQPVEGLVQFITPLSVFRNDGLLPFSTSPQVVPGRAAIVGYKWNDLDQDGQWDAGEPARAGWAIELLDAGGDVLANAVTDAAGRYAFVDLAAGEYAVRQSPLTNDGPVSITSFPLSVDGAYVLELAAGQVIQGAPFAAESPNFGGFEFSTLTRPADDLFGHMDLDLDGQLNAAEATSWSGVLAALSPWQSVRFQNDGDQDWTVQAPHWSLTGVDGRSGLEFLRLLRRSGGEWVSADFPLDVPSGQTVELLLFYDPAIRADQGARVVAQYPDWYDDQGTPPDESQRGPHTFGETDRVVFAVTGGPEHRFRIVGGSTFDSDISYNGRVDNADLVLLSTLLNGVESITSDDAEFDLTTDINARCANGAGGVLNTCVWAVPGTGAGGPPREIGLGDIGPVEVEFGRFRQPPEVLKPSPNGGEGEPGPAAIASVPLSRFVGGGEVRLGADSRQAGEAEPEDSSPTADASASPGAVLACQPQSPAESRPAVATGGDDATPLAIAPSWLDYVFADVEHWRRSRKL